MKAIILGGGRGTRLLPLTANTPKPMLPIGDKPHLEYIIKRLRTHGVTDIIFSTGYLHDKIVEYFGDGSDFGVKITYREDGDKPLGTAGAIKNCEDLLDNEPFIVFNGDILTNINLVSMAFGHLIRSSLDNITIALVPVDNPSQFGVAVTEHNFHIKEFVEKPTTLEYGNLINAGIYVMDKQVLHSIPKGEYCMVETDVFPQYAKEGRLYYYSQPEMYWLDIGTHERYNQAQIDVKKYF